MSLPVILLLCVTGGIVAACAVVFIRYYRYRFVSHITYGTTATMVSRSPEGYADKPFYFMGEEVVFYLRSEGERNTMEIRRMTGPFKYETVLTEAFGASPQQTPPDASENGCHWTSSLRWTLDGRFRSGYYQVLVTCEDTGTTFEIYFIIGDRRPAAIMIVAPVSTWTAYNAWGGKSLYQNRFENKTVYFVSTQRPNTAFDTIHAIHAEANIFNWFQEEYSDVNIIPDYLLEDPGARPPFESPGLLSKCSMLILAYHCEYISNNMHRAVRDAIARGLSLISLGGNQLYWVVRWPNAACDQMECHKDVTSFHGTYSYGGMWKHHFRPPQRYLGGRYNGLGMHTFAPYKMVANPDHWLLAGLGMRPGDLFGLKGIDSRPISGAETDKAAAQKKGKLEVIAHGMNCLSEDMGRIYVADDPRWDGSGGGDLTVKYLTPRSAVLNTASIHSGAGLGIDAVFTGIIKNFMRRYGPKV